MKPNTDRMRGLMVLLLVGIALMLTACAKHDEQKEGPVTCEHQVDVAQAEYPDGVTRKSEVWKCSDGCYKYAWVNDHNVTFNSCERF